MPLWHAAFACGVSYLRATDSARSGSLATIAGSRSRADYRELGPSLNDSSGVKGEWQDEVYRAAEPQLALLRMIGGSYLPFLAANIAAIETGRPGIGMIIDGDS